jgi:hypothetical protein
MTYSCEIGKVRRGFQQIMGTYLVSFAIFLVMRYTVDEEFKGG